MEQLTHLFADDPNQTLLSGSVDSVVFRSADERFSVLKVTRESDQVQCTIVGELGHIVPGETHRFVGQWESHSRHGRRFRAQSSTPVTPNTAHGIEKYLGSGLVPGIGPALAGRIVERFGAQTLDVIVKQSARLSEVSGIGRARARAIAERVRERMSEAADLSHLYELGLGPQLARRVLRTYGAHAVQQVRAEPYALTEDFVGVGFRTADRIGRAVGITSNDPRRAAAGALHILRSAAEEGHVFVPEEEMLKRASELEIPELGVREAVASLVERGQLQRRGEHVYLRALYVAETEVASGLAQLAAKPRLVLESPNDLGHTYNPPLSAAQETAVRTALRERCLVLTGGPGTGKTTTVRAIVEAQRRAQRRVVLAAPTGRAAKRLSEASGYEAVTLHRLLEWNPVSGSFQRGRASPLEADFVLVDEASMLDVVLAQALLAALPGDAQLVLVGDVDQLPPVGPGAVLREIIASASVPIVRLTDVFRQAEASTIVRGAHAILHGNLPEPTPSGTRTLGDLFLVAAQAPELVTQRVSETLERMRVTYGLDPRRDVQVLTPMRRGPLGVDTLNALLRSVLNPNANPAQRFSPSDRVMQLRNDYERDVFNGDLGEVVRVAEDRIVVAFDGRDVEFTDAQQMNLALAYASTVHKVQGSEFPAIVLVLHTSHFMLLHRSLVYTAVTRARKLVVIVGDPVALRRAVRTTQNQTTYCDLARRLREATGTDQHYEYERALYEERAVHEEGTVHE